jgi:hypothetical protein
LSDQSERLLSDKLLDLEIRMSGRLLVGEAAA